MLHAGPEQRARSTRSRRAGLSRVAAMLSFVLLGCSWLCVASGIFPLFHAHRRANRTKCSNNMRQLALAAIQYSDDKRFFPHIGGLNELDGGTDSNATTKIVRGLVWYGYHDNPEGFICPDSYDLYVPISDKHVKANMRLWFWGGEARGDDATSPFRDSLPDPVLDRTDELSYGWSRRSLSSSARSTAPLLADRAQADPAVRESGDTSSLPVGLYGNHDAGSNVAYADGTVMFVNGGPGEPERLSATVDKDQDGFLGIHAPARTTPFSQRVNSSPRLQAWLPLVALFGPPLLLGLFLTVLVNRQAAAEVAPVKVVLSSRGAVTPVRPSRVATLGPEERATLGLSKPPTPGSPVVLQHQQRCPVCHDGVGVEHPLSRCLDCRAVFHAECVAPGGACPTLGCGVRS